MSADYSNIQTHPQTRNGLAVASLVLGIISIPTLGLLGVGAITAIVLGVIALGRIKKEPATYGGKGIAIAGIITSIVSLLMIAVFGFVASVAVPNFRRAITQGRQVGALNSLRDIHNVEMQFNTMNSRFGTLNELAEAGLIDQSYAKGSAISGYVYSSSGVSEKSFCVHVVRTSADAGAHDFVICEDGIIRYVESRTPRLVERGEGAELDSSFYSR